MKSNVERVVSHASYNKCRAEFTDQHKKEQLRSSLHGKMRSTKGVTVMHASHVFYNREPLATYAANFGWGQDMSGWKLQLRRESAFAQDAQAAEEKRGRREAPYGTALASRGGAGMRG